MALFNGVRKSKKRKKYRVKVFFCEINVRLKKTSITSPEPFV
jgi:hypothetical protein